MTQRKLDMESPCNGCGTPLSFIGGEPKNVRGAWYHSNCVPSHSPSMDAEYYAGIRDGWQRHQDKKMFGEEYADAADMAREMRREGYAWEMPTPPVKAPSEPAKRTARPIGEYQSDRAPKLDGYDLDTVEGCRAAYRAARDYTVKYSYSGSAAYKTAAAFDAAVLKAMADQGVAEPTPRQWVKYAHSLRWYCGRCGGTGRYVRYVENGVPKGPGGPCYRCDGKGSQTPRDAHRNYWHMMKMPVHM